MSLKLEEKRIVYKGMPGTLTVFVELTLRDEFAKSDPAGGKLPGGDKVMSLGDFLKRDDFTGLTFRNIYTGETLSLSREDLGRLFADYDLDNSIVGVTFDFKPDPGYEHGLKEAIEDDFRKSGLTRSSR